MLCRKRIEDSCMLWCNNMKFGIFFVATELSWNYWGLRLDVSQKNLSSGYVVMQTSWNLRFFVIKNWSLGYIVVSNYRGFDLMCRQRIEVQVTHVSQKIKAHDTLCCKRIEAWDLLCRESIEAWIRRVAAPLKNLNSGYIVSQKNLSSGYVVMQTIWNFGFFS